MPEDLEQLAQNLKDEAWHVRRDAAKALGELRDDRAVELLIAVLRDREAAVRVAAAEALGELGDVRAEESLIAALWDRDRGVQIAVRSALLRRHPICLKRILFADDEPFVRALVSETLQDTGYDVWIARNGMEVVQLAQEILPDLILLDVMMPRMTGYESCIRLKQIEATRDIPVVILTARGMEADIQQGLAVGAVAYITKPFNPDDLILRINEILDSHRLGIYD